MLEFFQHKSPNPNFMGEVGIELTGQSIFNSSPLTENPAFKNREPDHSESLILPKSMPFEVLT
jgi:hypothetical protein